jgi:hypothetical protein
MKKVLAIAAIGIAALSVSACHEKDINVPIEKHDDTTLDTDAYDPSEPGGMGMTYNGKLGFDMGGGLILPYDGSGLGLGFGF